MVDVVSVVVVVVVVVSVVVVSVVTVVNVALSIQTNAFFFIKIEVRLTWLLLYLL